MDIKKMVNFEELQAKIVRMRGNPKRKPDASIIIPVNAQGDLENLLIHINDISLYKGKHKVEIIPVINNYSPDNPPAEIELFRELGLAVVSLSNARIKGEVVGFSARIPGLRAAKSDITIHFDSDCRTPNPTKLIDFYINTLQGGADLAYTPVLFYDLRKGFTIQLHLWVHYIVRWLKRNIWKIPTARGSNYAISRKMLLGLYETGQLTEDIYIGQNVKAVGGHSVYRGSKKLAVYTSGRMFNPGWGKLFQYIVERVHFHLHYLGDTRVAKTLKKRTKTEFMEGL